MADPTDTTSMALPPRPPCPKCQSPARLFTSILDVKRNKPVKIFRCDTCREEIWDGM